MSEERKRPRDAFDGLKADCHRANVIDERNDAVLPTKWCLLRGDIDECMVSISQQLSPSTIACAAKEIGEKARRDLYLLDIDSRQYKDASRVLRAATWWISDHNVTFP